MQDLVLYTTLGCHLCERAKEVIWPVISDLPYKLVEVDIANDEDLVKSYGLRIPVVRKQSDSEDLGWPFDEVALKAYLGS